MNLKDLTDEELDAWRVAPITELLQKSLQRTFETQKQMALEAYWSGSPWSPEDLASLKRAITMQEDIFESSADDLRAVMEQLDEYERNTTD